MNFDRTSLLNMPKPLLSVVFSSALALLAGCATDEPSPAMRAWAQQQIAEKQRLEVAQQDQAQEIARLKANNASLQAQAEEAKHQAEATTWVANNKKEITAELTKTYEPVKQQELDVLGIQGKALVYLVDDASFQDNVLYFEHLILWQKPDGTGGVIRIVCGQNVKTNQFVFTKVAGTRDLSAEELADLLGDNHTQEVEKVASAPESSTWAPSNETVNAGYQACIKVAATAAGAYILSLISGN